jgi:DnaD/phage-associated family protein
MSTQRIGLVPGAVSMSARSADALIAAGDGDAALLFLYLLRQDGLYDPAKAARALRWEGSRLTAALASLRRLGLAAPEAPEAEPPAPRPDDCPDYSTADVTQELGDPGSQFPGLLAEVERQMGHLSSANVKLLLEIYDHVGLPPEVILLLVNHSIQETERLQGQGRRPRMSQIRAVAYRWKEKGIDSVEGVTAYLKKLEYYHSQEGQVLAVLGIRGREAVAAEQKYIHGWLDMGFPLDAIALAHEKTVLKTGAMNWPYCNSILKRWHQKNLHTPEEIAAGDGAAPKPASTVQPPATQEETHRRSNQDVEWMRQFLKKE